jgi:hypothetical protein
MGQSENTIARIAAAHVDTARAPLVCPKTI